MIYLGIDPGKKGALAILDATGPKIWAFDKEAYLTVIQLYAPLGLRCCLEKVHAMPKQGVASTFSFGESYGWLKGILDANSVSYQEIPPERWKKEFGLNTDKKKSIEVCRQLFPEADLRPNERSRVGSDGMAEALLMAEYARRKL